jgi:hypothetical protein
MDSAADEVERLRGPKDHGIANTLGIIDTPALFARKIRPVCLEREVVHGQFFERGRLAHFHMCAGIGRKAQSSYERGETHIDGFAEYFVPDEDRKDVGGIGAFILPNIW